MKVENKQINQKKQDSEEMSSDNPSEFLKTSRIMKKTILLLACVFGALSGYAQLKVNSSGQVGIGTTNPTYRGTKLYLASGSTLIVDGATLTDVSINYVGTTGTSIQILHNGAINYVDNQDFVVPLGVTLDIDYGKIN